ncbi:reverse transcriptase domain-containing protein [Artemisia annua]|uniref:Reverse transcriptase domain-containing protein n=1 Tax=Artemisia annua TaxID=35608 RepID=A0A2U1L1R1_ARTAN|nr:reverse transcriptase domain-containing protein [Artemisia annua]
MVNSEAHKIERYIGGLPPRVGMDVVAVELASLRDAIVIAHARMSLVIGGAVEEMIALKKKWEGYVVVKSPTTVIMSGGGGFKRGKPKCVHCNRQHFGRCSKVCYFCHEVGHVISYCKLKTLAETPTRFCFRCGMKGHLKKERQAPEKLSG